MNVQISLSEIYYNYGLRNFLMREHAYNTLNELISKNGDEAEVLNRIEEYADDFRCDFDEIEEMFYNDDVEDLAETFGLELRQEGDEDEDEE